MLKSVAARTNKKRANNGEKDRPHRIENKLGNASMSRESGTVLRKGLHTSSLSTLPSLRSEVRPRQSSFLRVTLAMPLTSNFTQAPVEKRLSRCDGYSSIDEVCNLSEPPCPSFGLPHATSLPPTRDPTPHGLLFAECLDALDVAGADLVHGHHLAHEFASE